MFSSCICVGKRPPGEAENLRDLRMARSKRKVSLKFILQYERVGVNKMQNRFAKMRFESAFETLLKSASKAQPNYSKEKSK